MKDDLFMSCTNDKLAQNTELFLQFSHVMPQFPENRQLLWHKVEYSKRVYFFFCIAATHISQNKEIIYTITDMDWLK